MPLSQKEQEKMDAALAKKKAKALPAKKKGTYRNNHREGIGKPEGAYRKSQGEGDKQPGGAYRANQGEDISNALAALKKQYTDNFYFSDASIIDLVLGVVAGNHLDGDPIWIHLISPPSGGKTELLFSVFDCKDDTFFLSDFTPAALISGYKEPPPNEKPPT